ncbi:MAG: amidohydrolase family protein [Vicinamibacterales bacterium]
MAARFTAFAVVGIVVATLIAGLIVGAQRDDSDGPVDLIVHNAIVFTGDTSGKMAEAVAVRANQILKVGSNREIMRMRRPQTVTIDAKGGAVLPGFNDAHLHLVEGGLALEGMDLTGVATVEEAVERVRVWAEGHPDAGWVEGRGWTTFEAEEHASRQALDAALDDRPVYLLSEDGTTAWVNSRALQLAHVTRRTPDPTDGHIVKDVKGEPTGVLEGSAATIVSALLPKADRDTRMRAILAALAEAKRNGITSIQVAGLEPAEIELLDTARRGGRLETRVYAALAVRPPRVDADIVKLDPGRYPDDPMLKSGVADVDAAASDGDGLNRLVRLLDARGWQVSIHQSSMEERIRSATALSHAMRSNPARQLERRHRVQIHADQLDQVGTRYVVGSDWPYGPLSPARVLASIPEEMLLKEAIVGYTAAGAYASHDEQRKGMLKPGMLADIVVLSKDIFKMERRALSSVAVVYTIFDGRVVFPEARQSSN